MSEINPGDDFIRLIGYHARIRQGAETAQQQGQAVDEALLRETLTEEEVEDLMEIFGRLQEAVELLAEAIQEMASQVLKNISPILQSLMEQLFIEDRVDLKTSIEPTVNVGGAVLSQSYLAEKLGGLGVPLVGGATRTQAEAEAEAALRRAGQAWRSGLSDRS